MNHLPHSRLHSSYYSQVIKDISLGSQSVSHVMHAFNVIIVVGPAIFAQDILYTCKIHEFLRLNDAPILLYHPQPKHPEIRYCNAWHLVNIG